MIRSDDFKIEIGQSERGTFVHVTHKPTGNRRAAEAVSPDAVGRTRDSFIRELRGILYGPDDVRFDYGRGPNGDYMGVVHIPSGIRRTAMRRDGRTEEDLLDEVLEELFAQDSNS